VSLRLALCNVLFSTRSRCAKVGLSPWRARRQGAFEPSIFHSLIIRFIRQQVPMRIVCPSCAAVYEVPASRMTPRRMVRCARCGGEWLADDETDEPPPVDDPPRTPAEPDALPPVTAMDRLAVPVPRRPPRPAGLRAAWVMTFVILAAAVAGAIVWRGPVTRAWPPAGRILGSPELEAPVPASAKASDRSHPAKE
jgi:predicted Zn finger-like uncharacterized protein